MSRKCVCCVGFAVIQEGIEFGTMIYVIGLGVAPIEEKLVQHRLRWFGHVQRRPPDAPVRSGILSQDSNVKRGRGRPKLTWVEAIKGDLKGWNIPKYLVLDRSAWKQLFTCLNLDCFCWVSTLAYLNLFGT